MKVKFSKHGVFTSEGKAKVDDILDLPDDESNSYIKKGWCIPEDDVIVAPKEEVEEE